MGETILDIKNVDIAFSGVQILHNVSLNLKRGEVHALVGENGAGKSTLLKILSGIYRADNGQISMQGCPVKIESSKDAFDAGFCIIHQELVLAPNMTVYENIMLGCEPRRFGIYDRKKAVALSRGYLDRVGANIDPTAVVAGLSTANQQLVEIARSLSKNCSIIAMDEPTSSLTESEIKVLFKLIKELKEQGNTVIYVSHRMDEIFQIADRVTVMRDGHIIATLAIEDCNRQKIINLMAGKELDVNQQKRNDKDYSALTPILSVRGLNSPKLHDISFDLYPNEVLGLAGLVGAGRSSLLTSLMGIHSNVAGDVVFNGETISLNSTKRLIRKGIGIVPEDRKTAGLFLNMSLQDNMMAVETKRVCNCGFIRPPAKSKLAHEMSEKLDIRPRDINYLAGRMSGGNQQKVVIGKWLAYQGLKLLLLDEPTRGIDVGAKFFIHQLIRQLSREGLPIIVASSELDELLEVADRILVMRHGMISGELSISQADKEVILSYAF